MTDTHKKKVDALMTVIGIVFLNVSAEKGFKSKDLKQAADMLLEYASGDGIEEVTEEVKDNYGSYLVESYYDARSIRKLLKHFEKKAEENNREE